MGQTIRAINAARSDDPLIPEYIGQTAAIPLPGFMTQGKPEGTKSFLTGLSLMFEDPLQFAQRPSESALEVLSRMAPIPKTVAEAATGQSFFQRGVYGGRQLDDLNPPIGQTLANIEQLATGKKPARVQPVISDAFEQIAAGLLPFTGTATTAARVASDPRKTLAEKGLNLMTGFKTSDVSPAASDAMLGEIVRKNARPLGARMFSKLWWPEEVLGELSPLERQQAERLMAIEEGRVARAKQRKKERQAKS